MIKVGVIGGGINSAVGNAHFSAIRLSNNYDIVAAAFSRDKNINYETADKIGITQELFLFFCWLSKRNLITFSVNYPRYKRFV